MKLKKLFFFIRGTKEKNGRQNFTELCNKICFSLSSSLVVVVVMVDDNIYVVVVVVEFDRIC